MASGSTSTSSPQQLTFVTWNINTKQDIKKKVECLEKKMEENELIPHVIFLQESYIDVQFNMEEEGWKSFYTQYSNNQIGAAILVKQAENLHFTLHSANIDRNGRYVIVKCELLGQDYTLVSVYNRNDDVPTLDLLTPYLQNETMGALVIGGDFNTTFSEKDRAKEENGMLQHCVKKNYQHAKIRTCVERFMRSLQLVDVFRRKNGYGLWEKTSFTSWKKAKNVVLLSRLDYFFIPEEWMCSVTKCKIIEVWPKSGHQPLVLQLTTGPPVQRNEALSNTLSIPHHQIINEVDIVAAIQSLQLRDTPERPGKPLSHYKQLSSEERRNLMQNLNDQFHNSLPENINSATETTSENKYYFFNVQYLILATILAWRLEDWTSTKKAKPTKDTETVPSPTEVAWNKLKECIKEKLKGHPRVNDFNILQNMLKKTENGMIKLCEGCPLTHILQKMIQVHRQQAAYEKENKNVRVRINPKAVLKKRNSSKKPA